MVQNKSSNNQIIVNTKTSSVAIKSDRNLTSVTTATCPTKAPPSRHQYKQQVSMGKNTEGGEGCTSRGEGEEKEQQSLQYIAPNVVVDDITDRIKAFNLSDINNGRKDGYEDNDLVTKIQNLDLKDKNQTEKPRKALLKPQESDERGNKYDKDEESDDENSDNSCKPGKPEQKKVVSEAVTKKELLVKLEEPSFEGNEDQENPPDQVSEKDGEDCGKKSTLTERGGPEGGVPAAYHNDGFAYTRNCTEYNGMALPPLPANFPNYSYTPDKNGMCSNLNGGACNSYAKRPMDQIDIYSTAEPQKYVRPQDMQHQQFQQDGMALNNLNNPGKQVLSNVYQKQMSGGVVYSANQTAPSAEQILGFDGFDELDQTQNAQLQDFDLHSVLPNIPVGSKAGVPTEDDDLSLITAFNLGPDQRQQQQQQQQQQVLPSVGTLINGLSAAQSPHYGQQQPLTSAEKRGSYGSNGDDFGYQSDLSPPHETPFSPQSQMVASPTGSVSSGLGQHPSVISTITSQSRPPSVDSGVGSPMSEDGSSTQGKSPRYLYNPNHLDIAAASPAASQQQNSHIGQNYISPQVFYPPDKQQQQQQQQPQQVLKSTYPHQPQDEGLQAKANVQTTPSQQFMVPNIPSVGAAPSIVSYNNIQGLPPPPPPQQQQQGLANGYPPATTPQAAGSPLTKINPTAVVDSADFFCRDIDARLPELNDVLEYMLHDIEEQGKKGQHVSSPPVSTATNPATAANSVPMGGPQPRQQDGFSAPQMSAVQATAAQQVTQPNCSPERVPITVPTTFSSSCWSAAQGKPRDQGPTKQASGAPGIGPNTTANPKVPIPQLRKPGQQQQQQQHQPLQQVQPMVLVKNVLVPIGPIVAPVQKPRYHNIAPKPKEADKAPVKGMMGLSVGPNPAAAPTTCKGGVGNINDAANTSCSQADRSVAAATGNPASTGNSTTNGQSGHGEPSTTGAASAAAVFPAELVNKSRRWLAERPIEKIVQTDDEGDNFLHMSICKGYGALVVAILERLAREKMLQTVNLQNNMGQTALYMAACTNNPDLVKLFIEYGADPNLFTESTLPSGAREKLAAIHCVTCEGEQSLATLKVLLTSPLIKVDLVNSNGHTALHCAILFHGKVNCDGVKVNSIPTIQALLRAGANPNLQVQQNGKTALMYALESLQLDVIQAMFEMIEPAKLAEYLKTKAFDGSTCPRIYESLKSTLDTQTRQRLSACLKQASTSNGYHSNNQ